MDAAAEPHRLGGAPAVTAPTLHEVLREWGRIGCLGFGGPPAHIAMLRELCVGRRRWLDAEEFEDGITVTNLLPGPASTQLAIYCAWRLRGNAGALVGGVAFIVPGLLLIIALAGLFLASAPPGWVHGAGAGAGAVVAAVAVRAGVSLVPGSMERMVGAARIRWVVYAAAGAAAAIGAGSWLVLVLLACGMIELIVRSAHGGISRAALSVAWPVIPLAALVAGSTWVSLAWTSFKVGALSYGGGFVIIPLMQGDAVGVYGWMTDGEFLNAVALGQVTPGPVVQTVAVVGYAAAGVAGAFFASVVAFAPSFWFVLLGGERFDRLRANRRARAFLGAAAFGTLFLLRRGVVLTLLAAGAIGAGLALAGAPLPD